MAHRVRERTGRRRIGDRAEPGKRVTVADRAWTRHLDTFEAMGWESRAADYDRYWSVLTARLADPLLDAAGAGPASRVLDVACGPGYLTGRAAERGALATGVDIAEAMVRRAQQHHPRARFRPGRRPGTALPGCRVRRRRGELGAATLRPTRVCGGRVPTGAL